MKYTQVCLCVPSDFVQDFLYCYLQLLVFCGFIWHQSNQIDLLPSRGIHSDDSLLPPEAEDGLLHDSDIHPLHHDCHPLASVLLDK